MAIIAASGVLAAVVQAAFGDDNVPGMGWWAIPAVGALVGLPLLLLAGYTVMRAVNLRLTFNDSTLSYVDVVGRRATIDRGQIEAVYDVALWTPSERGLVTIVAGPGNAALVGLWHKDWDQGQLRALWSELGRPFSRYLDTRYLPGLPIAAARQESRACASPCRSSTHTGGHRRERLRDRLPRSMDHRHDGADQRLIRPTPASIGAARLIKLV